MQIAKHDITAEIVDTPGIHVCDDPALESDAADLASTRSFAVYKIPGSEIVSRDSLLTVLADALRFPDHFGSNWDALEECLRDLPIGSDRGCLLIFKDAKALLTLSREQLTVFLRILSSVADFWHAEGRCFAVLLIAGPELSRAVAFLTRASQA